MTSILQPAQPVTSFGAPVLAHIPPNLEIPQGSEYQIQLVLLQILSQLRIQRDCSSALDELQREKVQWNALEEELEAKVFELKKQNRQLESAIADLQFEGQELRKGKCNITDTWTELSQNKMKKLEKQLMEDKQQYEELQIKWETERNEYEKKLSNTQAQVFQETQKVLHANFEMQALKVELKTCQSSEPCQEQEIQGPHALLKDKIIEFFSFLQENKLDVNTNLPANKWKPLHVAAAYGDITVIQVLLNFGADIDALDDSDTTPLMIAAERGNTPTVHYLIRENATLGTKDKYGYNALHRAAYGGYADTIHILIKNGYTTLNTPNYFHEYPLHLAAYYNHTAAVQILVDSGIPVDPLDDMSRTPLHRAADAGNLEVVKLLAEHKANIMAKSSEGKIPWDYAIQKGHNNVAMYLLHGNLERDSLQT